jgi:hypothetical protein
MLRILSFLSYDSRNLTIWNNALFERDSVKFRRGSRNPVEVVSKKSAARKFTVEVEQELASTKVFILVTLTEDCQRICE